MRFTLEGSVSGLILETGRPARIDNFDTVSGETAAALRDMGWRTAAGAPISVEGRLWGTLVVYSHSTEHFSFGAEERLEAFGEIVATAIANTESREETTRLAEEQAALRRVATLAAQGAPPTEVFDAVGAEITRVFGAEAASVTRYVDEATFRAVGGWSNGARYELSGRCFGFDGSISGLIFETGRPSRVDSFDGVPGEAAAFIREQGWCAAVGAPIFVEGSLWGALVLDSKSAEPIPPDTETRLANFAEIVAAAIANTESRGEISRLAEEQAALRRVATLVAQGAQPAELFEAVSAEVGRLVPADVAAISRFDAGGTVTTLGSWTRAGGYQIRAGEQFGLEPGTTGRLVYETHRPARLDNYESITGKRGDNPALRTGIGAPIIVEGRLWGVANIASWTEPLPADTEQRLMQFTELLATAIANAESRGELEASRARIVATADATRRKIERDLHDGAQQRLLSLALELRAAQAAVPPQLTEHRAELSHVAEGLTNVLDGLREIALGLHPGILAEGGLGPALKTLSQRSPIPVMLDCHADGRLPEHVEVAAYYLVSEALTNAAKYSRASQVEVDVALRDHLLRVTVVDDGLGGADPARGSGLLGLKDRAAAIGGTLVLESPPNKGTTLIAELPLGTSSP
jgi:signal transduction histidine kinase